MTTLWIAMLYPQHIQTRTDSGVYVRGPDHAEAAGEYNYLINVIAFARRLRDDGSGVSPHNRPKNNKVCTDTQSHT